MDERRNRHFILTKGALRNGRRRYVGCTAVGVPRPYTLLLAIGAWLVWPGSASIAQQSPAPVNPEALRARIERALADAPLNYPQLLSPRQAGVYVQSVRVSADAPASRRIAIDLSQRALTYEPSGAIEPLLDLVIEATAPLVGGTRSVNYEFTIDGLSLERFLAAPAPRLAGRTPSLSEGGTVLVSPGHGWYFDQALGTWHFQRPRILGIVEDLVNWDIAKYVDDELVASSINTVTTRYRDRDAAAGLSGNARWQEAAKYFIETLGVPQDVWNLGIDDYARDINARPLYANWVDSSALISIHNNGGQETGTETWYDATNGQQDASVRLAEIVQRNVVSAIRGRYNANWVDRGLRTCNGCKGENRLASRPAVIVEIAYMDTTTPDNDALHDEAFKRIVAGAIRAAVQEWSASRASVP